MHRCTFSSPKRRNRTRNSASNRGTRTHNVTSLPPFLPRSSLTFFFSSLSFAFRSPDATVQEPRNSTDGRTRYDLADLSRLPCPHPHPRRASQHSKKKKKAKRRCFLRLCAPVPCAFNFGEASSVKETKEKITEQREEERYAFQVHAFPSHSTAAENFPLFSFVQEVARGEFAFTKRGGAESSSSRSPLAQERLSHRTLPAVCRRRYRSPLHRPLFFSSSTMHATTTV